MARHGKRKRTGADRRLLTEYSRELGLAITHANPALDGNALLAEVVHGRDVGETTFERVFDAIVFDPEVLSRLKVAIGRVVRSRMAKHGHRLSDERERQLRETESEYYREDGRSPQPDDTAASHQRVVAFGSATLPPLTASGTGTVVNPGFINRGGVQPVRAATGNIAVSGNDATVDTYGVTAPIVAPGNQVPVQPSSITVGTVAPEADVTMPASITSGSADAHLLDEGQASSPPSIDNGADVPKPETTMHSSEDAQASLRRKSAIYRRRMGG